VLALRSDGSVAAWGNNFSGQVNVPPGLSNVVAIFAGYAVSLALKEDGSIAAWGEPALTNIPPGLSNIATLSAGLDHVLALTRDGHVVSWGGNNYGQTNVPPSLTNATTVAAGTWLSAAITRDGQVVVWGRNNARQTSVPTAAKNARAIALTSAQNPAWLMALNGVYPNTRSAIADAQIVNGFLVGLNLRDGGAGYITVPEVSIIGGGGTGATAQATIANGLVTGFTVTSAGSGYASLPKIIVSAPTLAKITPDLALLKYRVTAGASVGGSYQFYTSSDLHAWTAAGSLITAITNSISQDFDVDGPSRFFKAELLP
jgi:hypothetical protein